MMPLPIDILERFQRAEELRQSNKPVEAQVCILQAEMMINQLQDAIEPFEELTARAAVALFLKRCGNPAQAVTRFERVCELALELEPDTSQTIGDLTDMGECYEALNRLPEAVSAFSRARVIAVRVAPAYLPAIEAKIEALQEALGPVKSHGLGLLPNEGHATESHLLTHRLQIQLQCSSINYSLAHCGLSAITSLRFRNEGECPSREDQLHISISGYTIPCKVSLPPLEPGTESELADQVRLSFIPDRLAAQTEKARASLEIEVNKRLLERRDIWVLGYNECSWQQGHELSLAAFVHPNNPAVRIIAKQSQNLIRNQSDERSFLKLRETCSPDASDQFVRALYQCLKEQYDLVYDFEPPCWESNSQRLRFPDEVVVDGKGTCIDLALLVSAVLENVLYGRPMQPVIIIVGDGATQHALIGCWRDQPATTKALSTDRREVVQWVDDRRLIVMDSTGFTVGNPFWGRKVDWDENARKGLELLQEARRVFLINLIGARPDPGTARVGVTPIPIRREPPFGERALRSFWSSRQAWKQAPTELLQGTHLLIGLLDVDGGAAREFFQTVARDTSNALLYPDELRGFLFKGLYRISKSPIREVVESPTFGIVRSDCKEEASRRQSLMVDDLHLLCALLRHPGSSVTKALSQRRTSPQECLAYLERLYPVPIAPRRSEFPSEVEEYHSDREHCL
jgi:hypothetical protein